MAQFQTIDQVVAAFMDANELTIHKEYSIQQKVIRCLRMLSLDSYGQLLTVKLPVNANFTVNLPDDYAQYTKIGVLNSGGEVVCLARNDKLTNLDDLFPNRLARVEDNTIINWWENNCWYNFWWDGSYYNLYGVPSGQPFVGEFTINEKNNLVILNPNFQFPYLIVEYLPTMAKNGNYQFPEQFYEAIMAYLDWQMLPLKAKGGGVWLNLKNNYFNERRLAMARYKPFYVQDAYTINLENQRLVVKA